MEATTFVLFASESKKQSKLFMKMFRNDSTVVRWFGGRKLHDLENNKDQLQHVRGAFIVGKKAYNLLRSHLPPNVPVYILEDAGIN